MPEFQPDHLDEISGLYWFVLRSIQERNVMDWVGSDLSAAQFKTLFCVIFRGPLTVNQLSEMLGVGQPTASHLVDKLVRSGYLQRVENPDDRRSVQIRATGQGNDLTRHLWQGHREFMRSWLKQLGPNELEALRIGLSALQRIAMEESTANIESKTREDS